MIRNHFNSVAGREDKIDRLMNTFGQTRLRFGREEGQTFVVVSVGFEHLWVDPKDPFYALCQQVKDRFPWLAPSGGIDVEEFKRLMGGGFE